MVEALQGAINVDLTKLLFMTSTLATLFDIPDCRITRCGYTGEDGVEVRTSRAKHAHSAGLWGRSAHDDTTRPHTYTRPI